MSLNVGINQIANTNVSNKWANVNLNNLEEITNKILERSTQKTSDINIDYSKFNRVNQGIDLYNGKTDINIQRQVASANSSLNMANIDASYFNAQAAISNYAPSNIAKNIEGRLTIGISEGEAQQLREVVPLPKSPQVYNTANLSKDKRGSNPFATSANAQNEENTSENSLDILS